MATKAKKPAKAKAAAKKAAPAKAKKPAPKAKPAAAKKKPAPAKKPAAKKPVAVKKPAAKKIVAKKPVAKKPAPKKPAPKKAPAKKPAAKKAAPIKSKPAPKPVAKKLPPIVKKAVKLVKLNGWAAKQQSRLLQLKDELLDAMYDRDFALSLLSQERDSLFEIDAALKKIQDGTYGLCEISGKQIPHARLEALPFARYTVECQAELEKTNRLHRVRQPVTSLFGLNEDEGDGEEEEAPTESKE